MKKMKLTTLTVLSGLILSFAAPSVFASEEADFREAVEKAIGPIVREEIDVAIKATEQLVRLAAELVSEGAHDFEGNEKILIEVTLANIDKMLNQSPEALEEDWHHGEAFQDSGINLDDFDHFSKVIAYYDMLIHPATAHSLLKEYLDTNEHANLSQAREELAELLEHDEQEDDHEKEVGDGH